MVIIFLSLHQPHLESKEPEMIDIYSDTIIYTDQYTLTSVTESIQRFQVHTLDRG